MRARLTVEQGPARGDLPDAFDLDPDHAATIGRSRDNTVVIRDEHSSRLHAKIFFENGAWHVQDFGLNGTRINGERITQRTELEHGQEIRIGDTRMRFLLPDVATGSSVHTRPTTVSSLERSSSDTLTISTTRLENDELTILCQYLAEAVNETQPQPLIRLALQRVLAQTDASLTGFLSVDPSEPLPRVVLPESANVDAQLSRQLTRRVQREGKSVWLGNDPRSTSDSLASLHDALCIPLMANGLAVGALHVYKNESFFSDRDLRFCEALAGFLGERLHMLRLRRTLVAENARLRAQVPDAEDLVGDSEPMQALRAAIGRFAPQLFPVLLRGETGSGTDLVALALHRSSSRRDGPFVVVDCAAEAPSLIEGELFGVHRRSVSDEARHVGLLPQADEGTLFIDRIEELPPDCQEKLVRLLEAKTFLPIGATHEVAVDVRILACTACDLDLEVVAGRFRSDLLAKLRMLQIDVPPLRERLADVPLLAQYYLDHLSVEAHGRPQLTEAALQRLQGYSWPGNLRQFRAVLENAVAGCQGERLDVEQLALPGGSPTTLPTLHLAELERLAIADALKRTRGSLPEAARLLGITVESLQARQSN